MPSLSRRLLGIRIEEVSFARRGFRGGTEEVHALLERVGQSFLAGYHAALEERSLQRLTARLDEIDAGYRGFAFEGAGMALTLLDVLMPWRRRLRSLLAGSGDAHVYMVHIGAGWAIARLPIARRAVLRGLDPLLRWLTLDGYGFHQGFFHWPRAVVEHQVPNRLRGYAARAFDQGLGRSLWFVEGAELSRIVETIATFPSTRHADLWSGVGLACTYAGGIDRAAIEELAKAAGDFGPQMAQGSAFAAEARQRAGNPAAQTELACRVLCRQSAEDAARSTRVARRDLPGDAAEPAYEVWRRRIQDRLARAGQ